MKKIIVLLILFLCFSSGCNKKDKDKIENLTCTFESTKEGNKFNSTVYANLKNNIITNANVTMKYEDKNVADSMCEIFKATGDSEGNLECKDKDINIKNYHKSLSPDKDLTKEEFIELMEKQFYSCK